MKTPARRFLLPLLVFALTPLGAQKTDPEIKGNLNWEHMIFDVTIMLDLQMAGIKLPAGRVQAETLLEDKISFFIESFIMDVQADSSTTLGDLVNRGELAAGSFARNTRYSPSALSTDLSAITERVAVNLTGIAAELIRHSRPRTINPPLIPLPVRDYTGIVIIADESLPVHGRYSSALAVPCLFPKIWDSEMNLLYGRDVIDPQLGKETAVVRYVSRESIMRAVPSALDDDLITRVGENPLRIMARGIFGASPTDPVIDREDALLILSTENNRRLLREGRIAIVLDKKQLTRNIP
ncbi:MAG: polymerase [Spirochaetaceae bacterium]|jgi:hypothetical protein|nr:polymerase [Spirochaetaceae bacterium]